MEISLALLSAVVSYLVGAISFSRVISRLLDPKVDLEQTRLQNTDGTQGDRLLTIGATTASVRFGAGVGCLIGLLDILKGFVPTLAFKLLYPTEYYYLIASVFAVIGHNWPVYYRFKGGSGMATTLGGLLAVDWVGTLTCNAVGMLIGFGLVRDLVVAYTGWTWLMIPWLWIRTGNPVMALYALSLNLAFFLALVPELKRYIESRKQGKIEMGQTMESFPMGRGMLKIARMMGFMKEKG